VFRRRHPLPFSRWLKGLVWPRTGWRRFGVYHLKRLIRLPGTPHSIAVGVACGTAISFTPLIGFHLLLGVLLTLALRGNLLAGVAGTLIGNPWTLPFMWLASYEVGKFLLGDPSGAAAAPTPWAFADLAGYGSAVGQLVMTAGLVAAVKRLVADISVLAWPVLVGSIPAGIVAGLAIYFPLVRVIAAYQEARRRRRERRQRAAGKARLNPAAAPSDAGVG
jgi:uncharacterized protein (DUF2062 family)